VQGLVFSLRNDHCPDDRRGTFAAFRASLFSVRLRQSGIRFLLSFTQDFRPGLRAVPPLRGWIFPGAEGCFETRKERIPEGNLAWSTVVHLVGDACGMETPVDGIVGVRRHGVLRLGRSPSLRCDERNKAYLLGE